MAITGEVRNELIELVVGMFNAAPGFTIMTDLATASNAGSSVAEIAASLEASTEFKNLYPVFLTNEEFVTKLINSLVGDLVSAEQKQRGVDELVGALNAGALRSGVILTAVSFLSAVPADEEENWGAAGTAFNNKVEVATYFTIDQQASAGSLKELQDVIAAVTDDAASVTAAKGSIDGTSVAGQTFMLTAGVDTILGGAGDDVITAGVTNATTGAAITTLNAGDEIDGGAGRDTLNITVTPTNNNSLKDVIVKNVEVVNVTGANNLGVTSVTPDAATNGALSKTTLTVSGGLSVTGAVETIDFGDLATTAASPASGAGIKVTLGNVTGSGGVVYDVAVGASKSASDIASAVATMLSKAETAAGGVGATGELGIVESVTASGSVVTITYKASLGTTDKAVVANYGSPLFITTNTFDASTDAVVTVDTAATITNKPVAASDSLAVAFTTGSAATAGTIEIGNLATPISVTTTATSTLAGVATDLATAIDGKYISQEKQTITVASDVGGASGTVNVGGIDIALAATTSAAAAAVLIASAINGKVVTTSTGAVAKIAQANASSGTVVILFDKEEGNVGDVTLNATGVTLATGTITIAETERGSGIVSAAAVTTPGSEAVKITYGLGFGQGAATGTSTEADVGGTGSNITLTNTEADGTAATVSAVTDLVVTINGNSVALGSQTIDATVIAGIADGDAYSVTDAGNIVRDVVSSKLATIMSDSVTLDQDNDVAQLVITSVNKGAVLPTLGVGQTDASIGSSTVTVAASPKTSATSTQAQVITITDADGDATTAGELIINGVSYGNVGFLSTAANGITGLASTLNSVLGDGVASVTTTKTADAIAQIRVLTPTVNTAGATTALTIEYGNGSWVTADQDGTVTAGELNALVIQGINTLAGATIAAEVDGKVVVTSPVAGIALPEIKITDAAATAKNTYAQANAVDNAVTQYTSTVTVEAPVAGTPLPTIDLSGATIAETRQNISNVTSTTSTSDAAVTGSQFVGAEEVWLKGVASNATNLTVTDAQVAGLDGVTGIVDSVYTLGKASTLAISGSTTTTAGTAYINGGGTTLAIIGKGTTGFSLTENSSASATDDIDTLAIDTSGTTVLTVSGLTALETISQSGAGALTIKGVGASVSTITGGAGADNLTLNTATAKDIVGTAKDETVTGSLSGGAGNDVIVVTTSGAGVASVDAGAGDDTIKVNHTMTGEMEITAGAGNDTVWLEKTAGATSSAVSQLSAKVSVDGGTGIDTLALGGDTTWLTGDYLKLTNYATNFEQILFYGATGASSTPFDASKVSGIAAYTVTTGANYFDEVANNTSFTNTVVLRADTDYLGKIENYGASGLTIVTADYKADTDFTDKEYDAVYGQDISITHATLSQSSALAALGFNYGATYTVFASDVTLVAASIGGKTAALSSKADVTLAGQMETATVILSSARGATKTAAGNGADEYMATFAIEVDPASSTSAATNAMQGLTSITVSGAGIVTIDAGYDTENTNDEAAANLTVIDLSGMTDFADLTYKGEAVNDTYTNLSRSTVTLNSEVAETLKLGGALDTVVITASSVDKMDIIEGFSLVATADEDDDDDIVDYARSDVLNVPGTRATADNAAGTTNSAGSSVDQFTADDTAYASLDAALLTLAATANNEVVFHAEGNTYVFISDSNTELDSGDFLIQLVGIYDLDLLVNAII